MSSVARVLLPMPLPEAFDYAVPEEMSLAVGDQVAAPLGPRMVRGVVTELREAHGVNRPLKPLAAKLEDAALPPNTLAFVTWAAHYACEPPGEGLALALRGLRAPPPTPERLVVATGQAPAKMTPARARVLAAAVEPMRASVLALAAQVSGGVVKSLIDEGVLAVTQTVVAAAFPDPDPNLPGSALNPSQTAAGEVLSDLVSKGGFQAALLDGVTGSGKTEVYLEAVATALRADPGAQVLVLLPEIALTQAVIARFTQRFGAEPAEWHSGVSPPKRRRVWEAVVAGRCRIVIGARSALFLPFQNLKLIVVDEEHDGAFKQEDG
ncbi:MAG: primosomal protein N' family DNA-binding protein, partial [Caulobacteraceae bacterium]